MYLLKTYGRAIVGPDLIMEKLSPRRLFAHLLYVVLRWFLPIHRDEILTLEGFLLLEKSYKGMEETFDCKLHVILFVGLKTLITFIEL